MEAGKQEEKQVNTRKCAVIGCGHVGATIAYTLAESGMLSVSIFLRRYYKLRLTRP